MKMFILGLVTMFVVPCAVLLILLDRGYVNLRADATPSRLETRVAMGAVDASAERHGPEGGNPLPANETNLMAGLKLYEDNCSICHGDPSEHEGKLDVAFYPPVPKFVDDAPTDMTESQDFYIVKHGIRFSGMPAWEKKLTDEEIWQLSGFLKHLDSLPSSVDQEWKKHAMPEMPGMEHGSHPMEHMHH